MSPEELTRSLERDFTRCFASVHPLSEAPFAKALIEMHGGRFMVSSKSGQGTTVAFTLAPVQPYRPKPPAFDLDARYGARL